MQKEETRCRKSQLLTNSVCLRLALLAPSFPGNPSPASPASPASEPGQALEGRAGQPRGCTWCASLSHGPQAALASSGLPVAAAPASYIVPGLPSGPEGWANGLPAICLLGASCFRKATGRLRELGLLEEARRRVSGLGSLSGPKLPAVGRPGPHSFLSQFSHHTLPRAQGPGNLANSTATVRTLI